MTDILATIETDLKAVENWAESAVQTAWTDIWNTVSPVFTKFEPTLVQGVLAAVVAFMQTASADIKSGGLDDIEQAFIESLEGTSSTLIADAESLGSDVFQALIALAKAKL